MLRIPVNMHNVGEENVFRPGAWTTFGTAELEGADFRACSNVGPLYGKKPPLIRHGKVHCVFDGPKS
jgi:L-fucose/D-arabinose isomerase